MDAMKEALRRRRMSKNSPENYLDDETVADAEIEEGMEDDDMGESTEMSDIAPELDSQVALDGGDPMMEDDNMVALEPGSEDGNGIDMERLAAVFDQGQTDRPGLRGKAMNRIKGMMDKLKG